MANASLDFGYDLISVVSEPLLGVQFHRSGGKGITFRGICGCPQLLRLNA